MVPVVSFVGKSKTGKTTLLEGVIKELKQRGYRVGVIKHAHHGFEMDKPGTDSWRMAQAGSDVVVVSSPQRAAVILQVNEELFLNQMIPMFSERVDIILTEGYKQADTVKIHVSNSGADHKVPDVVDFLVSQINQSKSV